MAAKKTTTKTTAPVEIDLVADTAQDTVEPTTETVAVIDTDTEELVITELPTEIETPALTPTPDAELTDTVAVVVTDADTVVVLTEDEADAIVAADEDDLSPLDLIEDPDAYTFDEPIDIDGDADAVIDSPEQDEDAYFHLFFHAMSHTDVQLYGNIQISNKGMFGVARANVLIAENFNVRDVVLLGWEQLTEADYKALLEPVPVVDADAEERYFHQFFHAISNAGGQVHGNIQITNKGMFNINYSAAVIEQQFDVRDAIILGWKELNYLDYKALIS